jgi:4-amino-4-deoxy-L-arabinose transferase-like glycosyltransferase
MMQATLSKPNRELSSRGLSSPQTDDSRLIPLDPFPAAGGLFTPQRIAQITWALIILGIVVRLIRFLLRFPLWPDESYLAHNYLDRGYLDLLKPLDFIQIAPLLYLWVQKTFLLIFGFSEYSLRLYVLLCGIASLFLFRHLAARLLRGVAYLLAVGTFAVAYPLVRYSAEAKPYGSDLLVALVLLTLCVEWCRRPGQHRWWWALVAATPVAILLSYPAVFLAGGISVATAIALWKSGSWRDWLRWAAFNMAVALAAAGLFASSAGGQMATSGEAQRKAFSFAFPPLTSLGDFALYMLESHTGDAIPYPLGGRHGASSLTAIACLVALAVLIRSRRFSLAALCTVPLALQFFAAAVHAYPYGNHSRFFLYMGPVFCLLMGLGTAKILSLMRSPRWPAAAPVLVVLSLFVAIAAGTSVRDFLKPYKDPCFMRDRDFARWFWADKAWDAELVCLQNDLHRRFYSPPEGDDLASIYFCNQRIYSDRLAKREPPRLDRVSKARPLRCARFRPACTTEADEAEFRQWLKSMESQYQLVSQEAYPISFWNRGQLYYVDQVEVYGFVPIDAPAETKVATQAGQPLR